MLKVKGLRVGGDSVMGKGGDGGRRPSNGRRSWGAAETGEWPLVDGEMGGTADIQVKETAVAIWVADDPPGPGGLVHHKAGVRRSQWPGNPEGLHPRAPSGHSPRHLDSLRATGWGKE